MIHKKLIVIGGGAAGFFCALNAARMNPNLQVTLLEKTNKLLSKVKVSGGGRCNVTHALFDRSEMNKHYPRGQNFVKKTMHQFFTSDTINWFEERGVRLKTEKDGRMFPVTDSSQTIINCLMNEANNYSVEIWINAEVKSMNYEAGKFNLELSDSRQLTSDFVCVASGGYSKTTMFQWLENLGHSIVTPVPSLFTFNLPKHPITQLMGVSIEQVRIKIEGSKLYETAPLLITHWGLSGPVVLKLSAWGAREFAMNNYHFKIHINWLPDFSEQGLKKEFQNFRNTHSSKKINNYNFGQLPNRLWQFLLDQSGLNEETRFGDLPARIENVLIRNLVDYSRRKRQNNI